ncbi:FERM domain-containing protein 4A-like isoform X2 [Actinia tenebrosa]|uniref:FERM domain-containing protein 4A-like isoform X2 n=1 Tax=Actinia tenebrosa TaxID=6105 RepID=A0A6P8IYI3_ACTTE|nr:FERM domain-containing protein 4A-like isoform X2 [Actinia tenebrosa]
MNDTRRPRKCQVILLDERRLEFSIQPKLMACDLLDMVASHFNLHEKEYFGLAYTDESDAQNWLRMDKKVIDHDLPRYQEPLMLTFSVRFFVPNILILKEPITVELFFMQAKILIFKGSIHSDSEAVFELAGYALQAAYGDFTSEEVARKDMKKIPVLPTRTLKEHPSISYCEEKVLSYYKASAGQTRGETIVRYLCIFQSLPTYGVHYYEDKTSIPWWLGFSPRGIGVYDHNDKIKPRKIFQWNQIENIYFRDRKVSLEIRDSYRYESIQLRHRSGSMGRKSGNPSNVMVHSWYASTAVSAKAMWTMAISQHQFYLDKKTEEVTAAATRTLRDVARDLTTSSVSIPSSLASEVSDSVSSDYSLSASTLDGESTASSKAADREMAIALAARRDALMAKLKEKTDELRQLCIQEAEFIGSYPPETPYTAGKSLPPIRRRVGTSFEFSDYVVSGDRNETEEIKKHEMETEIQTKITSAARKLAEDQNVNKNVRKSRKLMYQKSLKKLRDMEEQLIKLKREYLVIDDEDDEDEDAPGSVRQFNGEPYYPHPFSSPKSPARYRAYTANNLPKRSSSSDISRTDVDNCLVNGSFHGSFSRIGCPPSPSTRSYQGYFDTRIHHSPSTEWNTRSPRAVNDGSRNGPAFQYSDSDTRSDSSTKPSSISSSYTNSEEIGDESTRVQEVDRSPPYRIIASSWDNLNGRYSRSPSPCLTNNKYAAKSTESVSSDSDPRLSPYSPTTKTNRAFSFGSAMLRPPQSFSQRNKKYLNTSELAILSNTGNAGSYSLSHNSSISRSGPNLADRAYGSTSCLLPVNKNRRAGSSSNVDSSYLNNNMVNGNPSSLPSFHEEDLQLEWVNDNDQQATLV